MIMLDQLKTIGMLNRNGSGQFEEAQVYQQRRSISGLAVAKDEASQTQTLVLLYAFPESHTYQ
jgi:hypothetical protein